VPIGGSRGLKGLCSQPNKDTADDTCGDEMNDRTNNI
jgi:hypothetical protein